MKNVRETFRQHNAQVYYDLKKYEGVMNYKHKFDSQFIHLLLFVPTQEFKDTQ